MNPQHITQYRQLADLIIPLEEGSWQTFRLRAGVDEAGLSLRLKFIGNDGVELQKSVPFEVFDLVEAIRDAAGPSLAWSEWTFDFNRDGKYNIHIKYPDSLPT